MSVAALLGTPPPKKLLDRCAGCGGNTLATYWRTVFPVVNGSPDTTRAPMSDEYQCQNCGAVNVVSRIK
jgi:hypothetical protein